MKKILRAEPSEVFTYFEELCAVPHGSGNMNAISGYCMNFAEKNGLKAINDSCGNVVIFKPGTKGYENSEPIILQGHLDMVCQKDDVSSVDFEKDGLDIFEDGDFIGAKGTTLGADNGIAVAMIMAVLAGKEIAHPPIEAVFTTDEEIGMLGAEKLDVSVLKGKKMINLDAEESDTLTVSCAGGSDFKLSVPFSANIKHGFSLLVEISGLKGGHSGVEIDKGRVNANILMGRLLCHAQNHADFEISSINGGSKCNAIPFACSAVLVAENAGALALAEILLNCAETIKNEISGREENCDIKINCGNEGDFEVFDAVTRDKIIYMLLTTPNGIVNMSTEIEGLVETSLNLGILKTEKDKVVMQYALRSNKISALDFLEEKLSRFAVYNGGSYEISGKYKPWEYNADSALRELYISVYNKKFGRPPKIAAIHAGLECAVFTSKIDGLDCIAAGPDIFAAHTVNERLKISSVKSIFELLCDLLKKYR